jgi:N utilization substance protein A
MFITDIKRVVEQVSRDKGIDSRILIKALEEAIRSAVKKKFGTKIDIEVKYNEKTGEIEVFQFKEVVERITEPDLQIDLEQGYRLDPECQIGDSLGTKMDTTTFGRIAAQSAKQVIIQKMKDAERDAVYSGFIDRKGEIINGIVQRTDRGDIIVNLGHTEGILPVREQVSKETYRRGERIRALIMDVLHDTRGPQIILSRTHPDFLVQLFRTEVPEISEGIVDIMGAVREAGVRAKFAVASNDPDIDPVGACVGMKGSRVQNVVQELRGEKIDIISWHVDAAKFVCNALAPAEISRVIIDEENRSMEVIVPDEFLSIAIGKRGQNVRLASKLTRWHLDVISESRYNQTMADGYDSLVLLAGIGISLADALFEKGFYSAEELCNASVEDLIQIKGIGEEKALKLIEAAKKYVAESRELKETSKETMPDSPEDGEDTSETDPLNISNRAPEDEALYESDASAVLERVPENGGLPGTGAVSGSNVQETANRDLGEEEDTSGSAPPPEKEQTDGA